MPKTILIAEDELLYGKILKNKLEKEGYNVILTQDGASAIQEAHKVTPDLILLDLIMPIKDGFQTLKELKEDEVLKNVKVIILSNLGQEEDIIKVKNIGANDYLVKADMQFQEVIEKIKKYLQ